MKNRQDDVIIIGAGLAGLSAAAYLSRKGLKVSLFEKLNQLGGFVHSFKRGPYLFEASTHQINCGRHRKYLVPVLEHLGIQKTVLIKSDTLFEAVYFNPDTYEIKKRFLVPTGLKGIREKFGEYFPQSERELDQYFTFLKGTGEEAVALKCVTREPKKYLLDAILALMLKNGKGLIKKIGMRRYSNVVAYGNSTYQDATSFVTNEDLRWVLNTLSAYAACSVAEINAFVMGSLNYLYFHDGPYLIKGGTSNLIHELRDIITANGGKIYKRKPVGKIRVQNGDVLGIETEDGEIHDSQTVLSAINTHDTFIRLIDEKAIPPLYREHILSVENSMSAFQIYMGLRINPKEFGFVAPSMFFDPTLDGERRQQLWIQSLTPESRAFTPFMISNYSEGDAEMAPEGHSSVCIIEFSPMDDWEQLPQDRYKLKKKQMETVILDKVEKVTNIPIRKNAEVLFSATPRTMKRYGSTPEGAVIGAKLSLNQCLRKRTQPTTPLRNLFLAGSFTSYPGVASCLESGIVSSNLIMKVLK